MNDPTVLSRGRFSLVLFGLLGSVILADAIHVEDRTQMEGGATDSALGAGMSSARPCEQMDPQLRRLAGVVTRSLLNAARDMDRAGGEYPQEFVDRLTNLYQYGVVWEGDQLPDVSECIASCANEAAAEYDKCVSVCWGREVLPYAKVGTEDRSGDPLVTRCVYREFVLALLWDVFLTEMPIDGEPDPGDLHNPLNDRSAERFYELLTRVLKTAFEEQPNGQPTLSFVQRLRLYRIVNNVYAPSEEAGEAMISALEALADRTEIGDGDRVILKHTLVRVMDRERMAVGSP